MPIYTNTYTNNLPMTNHQRIKVWLYDHKIVWRNIQCHAEGRKIIVDLYSEEDLLFFKLKFDDSIFHVKEKDIWWKNKPNALNAWLVLVEVADNWARNARLEVLKELHVNDEHD